VPYPLGAKPLAVPAASLGLEIAYMTYASRQFSDFAAVGMAWRASSSCSRSATRGS